MVREGGHQVQSPSAKHTQIFKTAAPLIRSQVFKFVESLLGDTPKIPWKLN